MNNNMAKEDFPNGCVICETCGAKYDSLEVYRVSHTAPAYEWVGECGHARLRWKNPPPAYAEEIDLLNGGLIQASKEEIQLSKSDREHLIEAIEAREMGEIKEFDNVDDCIKDLNS